MKKGLYLRFKMYKNGQLVKDTTLRKKTVWWSRIEANWQKFMPSKCWLTIHYATDMLNSGVYSTLKDLKQAYKAFSEQFLIDYARGGE